MMKNSLAYPVTWLGILAAGGVAVPVNSRSGELDARFVLDHSGAVAVVVDQATRRAGRDAPRPAGVPVGRRVRPCFGTRPSSPAPPFAAHGGTLANIQYTSGTTGFPKGCLLTHGYWQRMGAVDVGAVRAHRARHDAHLAAALLRRPAVERRRALRSGAHLVLLDGFHPTTFMKDVARFGVTVFYCLGVMPTLLMKQPPADHDRNAVERVFCSAIPRRPARRDRGALGGAVVRGLRHDRDGRQHRGVAGRPRPGGRHRLPRPRARAQRGGGRRRGRPSGRAGRGG